MKITLLSKVLVKKEEKTIVISTEKINLAEIFGNTDKKITKILFQKTNVPKA